MMRNGVLWERITPPPLINETEFGSWLPTPLATLGSNAGPNARDSSGRPGLQMAAMVWSTPNQRDWKDTGATQGNRKSPNLGTMVHQRTWPTPRAGNPGSRPNGKGGKILAEEVKKLESNGGQLNPTWVEWLMGWPLGWTDCAASATGKFREWCRSHGIS